MMSSPVVAVRPASTVAGARKIMLRRRIKHLAVLERGRVVGVISMRDIVNCLMRELRARSLRPLEGIPVANLMSKGVVCVSNGTALEKAARIMQERGVGSVLVMNGERVIGIVTETDLVRALPEKAGGRRVGEVMGGDCVRVGRRHSVSHVMKVMQEARAKGAVVVEGERPIGVITDADIVFAVESWAGGGRMVRYTRRIERAGRPMARHVREVFPAVAEDLMRKDFVTVQAGESVGAAASIMLREKLDILPVMEGERMVGVLTKGDLVRALYG